MSRNTYMGPWYVYSNNRTQPDCVHVDSDTNRSFFWLKSNYFTKYEANPTHEINQAPIPLLSRMHTSLFCTCTCWISKIEPHGFGLLPMVAAQPTYELDEEIICLLIQKEKLVRDLQDPGLSARRQATLQQWLAAIQARLATLQTIVDGRRNTASLSVTRIS